MPEVSGSRSADRQRLVHLLTPVITAAGFDLEELTIHSVGRRSVLRVVVDADEGADLDGLAVVSHAVSRALDERAATAFAGPYVLEVTSPGVDRPLRDKRHWRRAVGRLVEVPVDGAMLTARVAATSDEGVRFEDAGGQRVVAWDQLGPGRVRIEFNPPDTTQRREG